MFSSTKRRPGLGPRALLSLCLLAALGCGQRDEVTTHTVKRPAVLLRENSLKTGVVGAVVPRGETTWFFKLTGPAPSVLDTTDDFLRFVRELRFDAQDEPTWTLPESWNQTDERGLRFATIRIPDEVKPLELTVVPLPTGEGSLDESLLANVNRWRGQLKLAAVSLEEMKRTLTEVPLEGDQRAYVVSMTGESGGGMTPPFAGARSQTAPKASVRAASSPPQGKPGFDVPDGWQPVANDQFSLVAYDVGKQKLRATVTPLGDTGASLLDNVNRWRRQVGLPTVDDAGLKDVTTPVEVDGQPGHLVTLTGAAQSLLGAVVPHDGRVWYFKLLGPADAVEQERERFAEFVLSTKFAGEK